MRYTMIPVAVAMLGLAACQTPGMMDGPSATAPLKTADGKAVGTATATPSGSGVKIALVVSGMPAGEHGVHVHTTGACTPDFTAAGGHWNPTTNMHGLDNAAGQHAGDMPNLVVTAGGTGRLDYMLEGGATFAGLLEGDGSAFVVHAGRDDQKTDPSGDSGARIACGVFALAG